MEEKRLVPMKRFSGFTSNWTKNRLENLASFSKGKGYSKKDLTDIGHQLILYGRLYTKYETIIQSVDTYTIKQENSLLSKGKEVIVPSSGETTEDIARASAILEPNIIIGGDLNVIIPSKELDSVFLALNISNGFCQRELMKRAQGSSVVHLYNEDLISVTLHFPSIEEQQKIGEFFKVLDERIANQERKIAKVKALKDAYLTEMFPREGETVPKRRFKGFEGEWKRCKLKDYTSTITKGTTPKNPTKNGEVNFVKVENIKNDMIYPDSKITDVEHESYLKRSKLEAEDILFSIAGTLGRVSIVKKSILPANTNQALAIIRGYNFDSEFFLTSLSGKVISDFIKKNPTIGAQPNLSLEQVGNFIIYTPTLEEQQKIGAFFKNLDNQIEMEEKKLDKLQKMKEAYLEEMFV